MIIDELVSEPRELEKVARLIDADLNEVLIKIGFLIAIYCS